MDVTIDQLFQQIGRLHTENIYLNQLLAEARNEVSVLRVQAQQYVLQLKDERERD